jgi:hypothetical protein
MRGRTPAGPEIVNALDASEAAKLRLRTILETIRGTLSVTDACDRLGVCAQRFHQLREQMLGAAVQGLEPQTPGRRPRPASPEMEKIEALEDEVQSLRIELQAARLRERIALTMPRLKRPSRIEPHLAPEREPTIFDDFTSAAAPQTVEHPSAASSSSDADEKKTRQRNSPMPPRRRRPGKKKSM